MQIWGWQVCSNSKLPAAHHTLLGFCGWGACSTREVSVHGLSSMFDICLGNRSFPLTSTTPIAYHISILSSLPRPSVGSVRAFQEMSLLFYLFAFQIVQVFSMSRKVTMLHSRFLNPFSNMDWWACLCSCTGLSMLPWYWFVIMTKTIVSLHQII